MGVDRAEIDLAGSIVDNNASPAQILIDEVDDVRITGVADGDGEAVLPGLNIGDDTGNSGTSATVVATSIQQVNGDIHLENGSELTLDLVGGDDDTDGAIAGDVTLSEANDVLDMDGGNLTFTGMNSRLDIANSDAELNNVDWVKFGVSGDQDGGNAFQLNLSSQTIEKLKNVGDLDLDSNVEVTGEYAGEQDINEANSALSTPLGDLTISGESASFVDNEDEDGWDMADGELIITGTTLTANGDVNLTDFTIDAPADSTVTLENGGSEEARKTFSVSGTFEQVQGDLALNGQHLSVSGTFISDDGGWPSEAGLLEVSTDLDIPSSNREFTVANLRVSGSINTDGNPLTVTDSLDLNSGTFTVDADELTIGDSAHVDRGGGSLANAATFSADSTVTVEYTANNTSGEELPANVSQLITDGGTLTLAEDAGVTVHDSLKLSNQLDQTNDGTSVTAGNGATAKLMVADALTNGGLTVAEDDTLNLWYSGSFATTADEWNVDGTIGQVTIAEDGTTINLVDSDDFDHKSVGLTIEDGATLDLDDGGTAVNYWAWGDVMLEDGATLTGASDAMLTFAGTQNQWLELGADMAPGVDIKLNQARESSGKTAAGHIPLWTKLKGGDFDLEGQTLHLNSGVAASDSSNAVWKLDQDGFNRDVADTTDSHIAGYTLIDASGHDVLTFPTGSASGTYRPFVARFDGGENTEITVQARDSAPQGTSGLPIDGVESWSSFHWYVESSTDLGGGQTWGAELQAGNYADSDDFEDVSDLRIIRRFAGSQQNSWSMHGDSSDVYTNRITSDETVIVQSSEGNGHLTQDGSLFAIGIPTSGPLAPSFVTVPESPIEIAEVPDTVSVQFTAEAADEDWSIESYAIDDGPAFASIDSSSGEVTLTPQEGDDGTYDLVVSATDSEGNTAMSETVSIEVGTATPIADEDGVNELPEKFALQGNYPNPFNPTTNIAFDLPSQAQVSVTVYDMLGRQVMTFPTQSMQAGAGKTIQVDASRLASGAYVYRVVARMGDATKVSSGRMTLLK